MSLQTQNVTTTPANESISTTHSDIPPDIATELAFNQKLQSLAKEAVKTYEPIDNLADERQARLDSYYFGVKNTVKTTQDGGPPVEVTITSPTKLINTLIIILVLM